jgi:hypothetical protein
MDEYHRWRCMTVQFLSRSRNDSDAYERIKPVLQHFLKLHGEIFRLSEDRLRGLESELRSSVMTKAVELSLRLRAQRSLILVRAFQPLNGHHEPPDDRLSLITRPELVRLTSPYGVETGKDSVLVEMEMQTIYQRDLHRSNSSSSHRKKESSLPFSKRAGKAKSYV